MPSFVRSGFAYGAHSVTASSQTRSSITALNDGGFVVVWQTIGAVKAQRFDAQGVATGVETTISQGSGGSLVWPRVTSLTSGGYVVTWETTDSTRDTYGTAILARMFDASGQPVGNEFKVNTDWFMNQQQPTIAGLSDGGFVVAWQTTDTAADGSGWAVKAQRYSAAGVAVGAEFRVNSVAFGSQNNIDIAGLSNGGFVVTWQTGGDSNTEVYAQVYGADGLKAGGQIVANGSIMYDTMGKVAGLPGGGFVVTWMTYDSDSLGIRAQIFNASGAKVGADFAVNSSSVGTQMDPDVAVLADGTILITWDDKGLGIRGQAFTAAGQRIGGETVIASDTGSQSQATVAALANGRFVVSFTANDGSASGDDIKLQMLQYNSAPNAAPQLGTDTLSLSIQENQTWATTLSATDSDGPYAVTYSIVGGADAARFTLNASTGLLLFASAPNYEAPTDSDRNNVYQVIVRASDGELADLQTISVTVTNTNEPVAITSNGAGATAAISLAENKLAVTKVTAVDPEGAPIIYSISGGADASRFAIDSSTGALGFVSNPDFEQPGDSDRNNVYLVTVRASDGTWTDTQALTITVTNANDAPVIASNGGGSEAAVAVVEGGLAVTTVAAFDIEGAALSYTISGGADASRFAIDSATGVLSFVTTPDFEQPTDSGGNNVYDVTVRASDGAAWDEQSLSITVGNANERPAVSSNGGGASATVELDEGQTLVTTVVAVDPDGTAGLAYSITGGADAGLFVLDAATGALSFAAAPDYETPLGGSGNVYSVTVTASDGALSSSQSLQVRVRNVNEGVTITSGPSFSMQENGTDAGVVAAFDSDGDPVAFGIAGGADAHLFAIDPESGALRFLAAPDHEAPADSDGDNVYDVIVSVGDGSLSATRAVAVTVTNRNEAIAFASGGGGDQAKVGIDENGNLVLDLLAVDPDGDTPAYGIAGGADSALFMIDPVTNALRFRDRPNFESPGDLDGDNVYEVIVGTSDGATYDYQSISVTVANVYEGPAFAAPGVQFSIGENQVRAGAVSAVSGDGNALSYAITGGADSALFSIDAATGVLSFVAAPDFEAPRDSDGDNAYRLTVTASDGAQGAGQDVTIVVGNIDEPVELLSYGGAPAVALVVQENGLAAADVDATDAEDGPVTFSITGGADAALFRVDPYTGALSFAYGVSPDFEAPADSGGDNVYDVVVTASSSTSSADQAFAIIVADRNEGLWITSDGGGDATFTVSEGGRSVTTVTAFDPDGDLPTYSIAGGADSALFAIDPATGVLTFIAAPDHEAPGSNSGTNSYLVEVGASDGEYTATQRIRVQVGNVNEGVAIGSGGGGASAAYSVGENGLAVTIVTASDVDGDPLTYSITGGADSARFAIDPRTGALRFVQAPNFESPADSGGNNVYDVIVSVTDGSFTDSQAVAVTVANVNEPLAITSNGGTDGASVAVAENGLSVTNVTAVDPEGGAVSYAIAGGADAARFKIDSITGALAFLSAPNFEAPGDAGANNVYDVIVSASDGSFTDTQAIAVTVGNVNEGVSITSNGGGANASVAVAENGTAVTRVAAVDLDGGAVTYAIAGGADSARFTIDSSTGVLAFVAAPNFEAPGDAGANNVYDVIVSASDGSFNDTQAIAVTVTNVNETPVIASNGGGAAGAASVSENSVAVSVVAAADPDGSAPTYSIVGGADASRFTINAQTGALQFVVAPDWELPGDSNQDNVYAVIVRASDGQLFDDQALNVTVMNVRDGNTVTGTSASDSISSTSAVIALRTSNEEDVVYGRDGHDSISGMAGDDEIYGEGGNDTLVGGDGADKLTGGLGKDTFTYNAVSESTAAGRDLITDFSRSQGDKISLSGIDANSLLSANQAFTFIGTSAFSNVAGQLRYETSAGVTTIFGDVNGDGVADLQIQLSGTVPLIASDFLL